LRLAPSGHVIGIDMDAALGIASARGCDFTVLSELLPAAEAGLVERCITIEFGMTGLDRAQQCPLTARLPPLRSTCVTSGSDPKADSDPSEFADQACQHSTHYRTLWPDLL
jgi:hypothetical protein